MPAEEDVVDYKYISFLKDPDMVVSAVFKTIISQEERFLNILGV